MFKCLNVKITNRGFTLVEMLMAILVFTFVIGAISGLFISGIRGQRNALASQRLLDQTSYALEYMSRALRMAMKDTTGACISSGFNYQTDGSTLRFINHLEEDDCQEFFLQNGQLMQIKGGEALPLTSSKLEITSLNFSLSGQSQGDNLQPDNLQPKVTISLKIRGNGQRIEEMPEINIQTTISQRNLDILTF